MLNNIGTPELIVVAVLLLVLFGGKKLPELAHGLSESIKEFRKALKSDNNASEEKADKE